ncbi:MAG: carbon storage regulator [Porticoccaceae bacterium]|nr:MAG: carbon storage regulator [Porticoccaceae bacterium]
MITHRIDESLIIDDNIKITITNLNGNQVCIGIGIDMPKDILVMRELFA